MKLSNYRTKLALMIILIACVCAYHAQARMVMVVTGGTPAAAPPAALDIVQYKTGTSSSSTLTVTLDSTPTAGNILVAAVEASQYGEARAVTGTGWTVTANATVNNVRMFLLWKAVSGDTATCTFSISGSSADLSAGFVYEITGANTSTPFNQYGTDTDGTTWDYTTPALTPSVTGTLAIAWVGSDNAEMTTSNVSSGWTMNGIADPGNYHAVLSASRDSLTSDTVTAISNTFSPDPTSIVDGVGVGVLINPAS